MLVSTGISSKYHLASPLDIWLTSTLAALALLLPATGYTNETLLLPQFPLSQCWGRLLLSVSSKDPFKTNSGYGVGWGINVGVGWFPVGTGTDVGVFVGNGFNVGVLVG